MGRPRRGRAKALIRLCCHPMPSCSHKYCISFSSSKSVSAACSPAERAGDYPRFSLCQCRRGENNLVGVVGEVLGLGTEAKRAAAVTFRSHPFTMSSS